MEYDASIDLGVAVKETTPTPTSKKKKKKKKRKRKRSASTSSFDGLPINVNGGDGDGGKTSNITSPVKNRTSTVNGSNTPKKPSTDANTNSTTAANPPTNNGNNDVSPSKNTTTGTGKKKQKKKRKKKKKHSSDVHEDDVSHNVTANNIAAIKDGGQSNIDIVKLPPQPPLKGVFIKERGNLPVYQHRASICDLVAKNDVVLVVAETVSSLDLRIQLM